MGSCISNKQKVKINPTLSLASIDNSLSIKPKIVTLLLQLGSFSINFHQKFDHSIKIADKSSALLYKVKELTVNEKISDLRKLIQKISGLKKNNGKNKFSLKDCQRAKAELNEIEGWIALEMNGEGEKVINDKILVIKSLNIEVIKEEIEDLVKNKKFRKVSMTL